ncbi:MAG: phage tail tube protein [Pseudomonadota bacterium]
MAENTVPVSLTGATLAISATLPTTYDAAGYGATAMVYTLIGEVENYGNHGGTKTITEFTPVSTGIVTKIAGSKNYGTMTLMMASIPSDAGQVLLDAAFESTAHYSVKMTYPSGRIHYMDVLVAKNENQDGAANDTQKLAVDFALCKKPIKVAAV